MTFDEFDLDPCILAGVEDAGYAEPTPIQQQAIGPVLAGEDVLGVAQTGTGKTAAYLLPILQRLLPGPRRRARALIIAPTRELAEQIHDHCELLGRRTGLRCVTVYGGVGKEPQVRALRRGTEIVVACPGRLLDHMGGGAADLSGIETVVLDEADRLCDLGFLPDVRRILDRLPERRQTLFFSATMPPEIRGLVDSIMDDPVTVRVDPDAPARTVSHAIYPTTEFLRRDLLLAMVKQLPMERVLIFARTRYRTRSLARALAGEGHRVTELQGDMPQGQRQAAIDGFRAGQHRILVATDIAARGIDIEAVTHVINYDPPDTVEGYTHRIGRTGRAELTGEALTLAGAGDALLVRRIERVLGTSIERRRLEGFDYGQFLPERALHPLLLRTGGGTLHGSRRRRTPARLRRFS